MISDDRARQLHDEATRGKSLSAEKQSLLENWYAIQDCVESNTLGLTADETTLATLQAQVEAALIQSREQRDLLEEQQDLLRLLLTREY